MPYLATTSPAVKISSFYPGLRENFRGWIHIVNWVLIFWDYLGKFAWNIWCFTLHRKCSVTIPRQPLDSPVENPFFLSGTKVFWRAFVAGGKLSQYISIFLHGQSSVLEFQVWCLLSSAGFSFTLFEQALTEKLDTLLHWKHSVAIPHCHLSCCWKSILSIRRLKLSEELSRLRENFKMIWV